MGILEIKPKDACRYDILALGEVMLRLDPGEGRIRTARNFRVWEGGGEYNVARGLRRCFGQRAAVVTGIVKNEVGLLLEDLILQGGVGTSLIKWVDSDGIGRTVRNGLNFTERGFGVRGAVGCSDRGNSAASQLRPGDIDWEYIFGDLGVRWFHTGCIFAGLAESTGRVVVEAMKLARKYGTIISYDLNYRPSQWKRAGGIEKCRALNQEIAQHVDVMIGFPPFLGVGVEMASSDHAADLEAGHFEKMINMAVAEYPNFKAFASTIRKVKSATINDWGAICWADGRFYTAIHRPDLEILDRVGGGDSFASGLIYGLMHLKSPQQAVEYGAAHGALAMTTPGDTSMVALAEVEKLVSGGSARADR
jgi:2-dehydro-3-deoxygluconokinase